MKFFSKTWKERKKTKKTTTKKKQTNKKKKKHRIEQGQTELTLVT